MINEGVVGYQSGAMRSALRSMMGASLPLVAILVLASVGCEQMGALKAKKAFKEANQAYQQQDFKRAAQLYEEVVADDPTMSEAYFYLANSYDNQYKPSRAGRANRYSVRHRFQ